MNNVEPESQKEPKNGESFIPVKEENTKLQYIQPSENQFSSMKIYLIVEQIILWALLIFFIVDLTIIKLYTVSIPLFVFVYICNIACHCYSPEFSFLGNKIEDKTMYDIMLQYFSAAPKITLKTESYHVVRSGGKRKSSRRVVTHREEEEVKYYSFKDVSGLFLLDIPQNKNIIYIQLQIINEINFADPVSSSDYMTQKEALYERNKNKDRNIDYFEIRTYDGYSRYNLIKLKGQDSCFFKKGIYMIFILLTLGLIYYAIFNCYCLPQNFRVRKLVSTRYNLLDEEHSTKYESLRPTLSINSEIFKYDEKETGVVYESNKMAPPSIEEIENAKQYQNYIPDYQISSVGGIIGIVVNNNLPINALPLQANEIINNKVIELNNQQSKDVPIRNNIHKGENSIQQLGNGVDHDPQKNQYLSITEENKKV